MEKIVLLLLRVLSGVGKCAQYPVRSLSANFRLGRDERRLPRSLAKKERGNKKPKRNICFEVLL